MSAALVHVIAAVSDNGVIGVNNTLPWHLPEDLQFFKKTTQGSPIIMGRNTYESIGRPLPGRLNIVVSRTPNWRPSTDIPATAAVLGAVTPTAVTQWLATKTTSLATATSLEQAIAACQPCEHMYVIGGAQLYACALTQADQLILTEVHTTLEGDAFFPAWSTNDFKEVARVPHPASDTRPWAFDFVTYQRQ